ncbi:MAG: sigma 54-interacting transcriptional regulator [Firmicutes bacterium]|nr:sigma 54-interacting transcriptional regulator [Bacillota bacterium]
MKISGAFNPTDLLEYSNDGFFITDVQGRLLYCNPATAPLVGLNLPEFGSMETLLKKKMINRSTAMEAIQKKSTVAGEVRSITGKRVMATSALVYNPAGRPDGVICNIRDFAQHDREEHFSWESKNLDALENYKTVHIDSRYRRYELVYSSNIMEKIINLATSLSKVDSTVLIYGETGVGKELFAHFIHNRSPTRKGGPFIKINCASIPVNLVEAELFGYEPGSFTGALKNGKKGYFELASGGTLFLDEIGELPLEVQPKLLNVLQDKCTFRVGGTEAIPVDVRIVAATNRNLQTMVAEGKFREDLYFRLNVVPLEIPPLRDRKIEIPALFTYFQNKFQKKYALDNKEISLDVIKHLYCYPWPGNVRELANLVERLLIVGPENTIRIADLPAPYHRFHPDLPGKRFTVHKIAPLREMTKDFELAVITKAIERSKNQKEAAEMLEISSSSLSRKLKDKNRG